MKKLLVILLLTGLLIGCNEKENFIAPIEHSLKVSFGEAFGNTTVSGVTVTITNLEDGKIYTVTTEADGLATVEIIPGVHNFVASLTMTPGQFLEFSGQTVDSDISFNASLENIEINIQSIDTELVLVSGKIGNVILKQVYYSGSDIRRGSSFRDQFFEVHNNSNETIYLDQLCFAQAYGQMSMKEYEYLQSNGQFDWSLPDDQTDKANANTGYVYADEVIRIPGTGDTYPLASGESAIIAGSALNHKAPLTVTLGNGKEKVYEVLEPDLTIDLSGAPFEVYFVDYFKLQDKKPLDTDIDNPNSVNLEVIFKVRGGKDLILDPLGRDAFVIFYASDEKFGAYKKVSSPRDSDTQTYLQIPIGDILDGVETQHVDPAKSKPKRIPDAVDAGEVKTVQGHYSSESVIRKIAKTIGDRVIYQDTNNSTNDFEVLERPQLN